MLNSLLEREFGVSTFGLEYNNNLNIEQLNSLDSLSHIQLTFPCLTSWLPLESLSASKEIHLHSQGLMSGNNLNYVLKQFEFFKSLSKSNLTLIEHFQPERGFGSSNKEDLKVLKEHTQKLFIENLPITEEAEEYLEELINFSKTYSIPIALDLPHLIISAKAANKGLNWVHSRIKAMDIKVLHVAGLSLKGKTIGDSHKDLNLSYLNSFRYLIDKHPITIESNSSYNLNAICKAIKSDDQINLDHLYNAQDFATLIDNLKKESDKIFSGTSKLKSPIESKCTGLFCEINQIYPFTNNICKIEKSILNDKKILFRTIGRNLRLIKNSFLTLTDSLHFEVSVTKKTAILEHQKKDREILGTWTLNLTNKTQLNILALN